MHFHVSCYQKHVPLIIIKLCLPVRALKLRVNEGGLEVQCGDVIGRRLVRDVWQQVLHPRVYLPQTERPHNLQHITRPAYTDTHSNRLQLLLSVSVVLDRHVNWEGSSIHSEDVLILLKGFNDTMIVGFVRDYLLTCSRRSCGSVCGGRVV